jgi:hypothetical protein
MAMLAAASRVGVGAASGPASAQRGAAMVSNTTPVPTNTIVQWNEMSRRVEIVIMVGERRIAEHRRCRPGARENTVRTVKAAAVEIAAMYPGSIFGDLFAGQTEINLDAKVESLLETAAAHVATR